MHLNFSFELFTHLLQTTECVNEIFHSIEIFIMNNLSFLNFFLLDPRDPLRSSGQAKRSPEFRYARRGKQKIKNE